jgi:hypothetical protein
MGHFSFFDIYAVVPKKTVFKNQQNLGSEKSGIFGEKYQFRKREASEAGMSGSPKNPLQRRGGRPLLRTDGVGFI